MIQILKGLTPSTTIIFLILLVGCNSDGGKEEVLGDSDIGPDVADSDFYTSENNSARLEGDIVGSGKSDQESLIKVFDITISQPSEEFKIEKAYVTRQSSDSEAVYLIVPVKNISDEFLCFVNLKNITYKDQNGNALEVEETTYIDGSIGHRNVTTNTCIDKNEVAYATNISLPQEKNGELFSKITAIEIASRVKFSRNLIRSTERLLPTEYVAKGSSRRDFEVKVENQGSKPLTLGSFTYGTYILLDSDGFPLNWRFLLSAKDNAGELVSSPTLEIGESASLSDFLFDYEGTSSTIRPILDFEISDINSTQSNKTKRNRLNANSFETIDQYNEYLHQQKKTRNDEQAKNSNLNGV